MRKTMLAAAAVAAVLSIGATANEAAAMPTAAPTQLGLATSADTAANSGLVQKTAIVCGYYGCRRVCGAARIGAIPIGASTGIGAGAAGNLGAALA
jgi:hypothetical protein